MRRPHPNHEVDIPISLAIYNTLGLASMITGYAKEDWEIAEEAIHDWARRNLPDAIPLNATQGYQWKSLFLPNGTVLRTVFGGKNHHCRVDDDLILYDGQAVSPSGFVNAVGGVRRNAWRSVWVLLPTEKEWTLADSLRPRQRAPRQRKPARPIRHTPTTQSIPDRAPATIAPPVDHVPDQAAPQVASVSDEPGMQRTVENMAQPTSSPTQRLCPQGYCSTAPESPPRSGGAHRGARADDCITLLLRDELLPLLNRLIRFHHKSGAMYGLSSNIQSHKE
jgi:hypothetical protein